MALAGLAFLGGLPSSFAAEELTITGPIIELPKFEVTDSRLLPKIEKWRYAEIPGFEILSSISERETKRFARDFLLLQEVIDAIMPGLRTGQVAVPTSLILSGRGSAFEQFVPVDRGEDVYRTNSIFLYNGERGAIVVDFQLSELQTEDNTITLESDPYRGFYREYFRFIIRRSMGHKPPAWFEEGLVQLFSAMDFQRKWISFAMIGDGFGGPRTGDFNRLLADRALLPLPRLFADPPEERGTFWDAQAYAFVHMCLYGRNLKYQKAFVTFVGRIEREPLSEALFEECFKMKYKAMELELRGYLDFTDHKYIQYSAKKCKELPEPPAVALVDAPDAVVGRIKGEALRLGGHGDEAHNTLIAPYVRGERDPRLLAALGLDERISGNDERALKFLEAAAAAKVERARAYLELARLRLNAARAHPAAPEGKLDAKQMETVLAPLTVARTQPPPLPEAYELFAEAWSVSAAQLPREQLAVLVEGVRRFPRRASIVFQAALLAASRGFASEARSFADYGVKIAKNDADRDRFNAILAALQRDAAPAEPAPAAAEPTRRPPNLP